MSELITLSKKDAQFESYLLGTFSKTHRALPQQTLNVNSASELVTFRVLPLNEITKPSFWAKMSQIYKVRTFLLIFLPLFLILTKNIDDQTMQDPVTTAIATIGVLLAFISINLRNDYMDHMKGVDRVLERSGSRAIQNGWITAAQVKHLSSFFLFMALVCAVPLLFAFPQLAGIFAVSLVVGLWAQFKKQNSFKYRIGGEFALFVMLGPLLTVGFQIAMGVPGDVEAFWLGCVWGWLVLFVVHLRNFMNIFPSSQAGFTNTVNWLGFDKARRLIAGWWILFLVFNLTYHLTYAGFYWGVYLTVVLAFASVGFIYKLKNISSPVGSEMRKVFRSGFYLFLIAIGMWVFECLWYLLR
ncbi:prenyltransferase [Bdellovibrio bacteriovorus]|uniref:1,4-dihydroxy-2-naphthoate octaprenyltransferase n=1 Tax=Bdellovibrio bacteriovorus (strain ATCC 15356 / DSM 50701 / NCIMB 9529 / HD100) TaxID=264462 RepID=Q6MQB8_BDEBA|nr:prenyltransferase [Bdellovibrio bacteriovorus]AHZ86643.1 1,4-dihydroxy-2-naphthoate octaprenyltransferase [Bdellovibrio bacteriovorus]BEV67084.1 1,4-dihydroxy-2-naphthoate octaprenyltransferase [Bdellovibrio bacteriovorus]CAE78529.1 1,4-dihydroxy-2-naphthoate octaprenyltransferase [Bdellovibrio bacteriovorus HD100]